MGTVTVRSARAEDLPRLVELLEFGALEEGKENRADIPAYASALDEIRSTPGCDVLVAEADGEVVGTCQLIVFRHFQARGGRCAEIESMHVHPDFRSRGIGGRLLAEAIDAARRAGCYRVQLTSDNRRPDAHRFYEREGLNATHVGFKRPIRPN